MKSSISIVTLSLQAKGCIKDNHLVGFDGKQAKELGQKVLGPALTGALTGDAVFVVTHGTALVVASSPVDMGTLWWQMKEEEPQLCLNQRQELVAFTSLRMLSRLQKNRGRLLKFC